MKTNSRMKLRALTEGAIMVALAQILGYIKLYELPNGVTAASTGMLLNQPVMFNYSDKTRVKARIMPHARELLYIQNELWWHRSDLIEKWENPGSCDNTSARSRRRRRRPYRSRRRKDNNTGIQAASPENTGE